MKTVILAAGFGSRLWPLSTSEKPKQFQPLIAGQSLLLYTYQQLNKFIPSSKLYVLVLAGMEELVRAELPNLSDSHIICVPERRNTLPHTLWALTAITNDPNEPVLFKPVDQYTLNDSAFTRSLKQTIEQYDSKKALFTLLCPDYAAFNSNDGYCIADSSGRVLKFLEKPARAALEGAAKAHQIYRSPMIYITSTTAFLDVLSSLEEPWAHQCRRLLLSTSSSRQQLFLDLPFLDISSTIFQHSNQLRLSVIDYQFIDVGRFEEIYQLNDKDSHGNVTIGDVIFGNDCHGNLVINQHPAPLVVMSAYDSVIVQTAAGSLVSPLKDAGKIGEVYKQQIHTRPIGP